MFEKKETKIESLRKALIEGEKSGAPKPYDHGQFLAEMKQKWATKEVFKS